MNIHDIHELCWIPKICCIKLGLSIFNTKKNLDFNQFRTISFLSGIILNQIFVTKLKPKHDLEGYPLYCQ